MSKIRKIKTDDGTVIKEIDKKGKRHYTIPSGMTGSTFKRVLWNEQDRDNK